MTVNVDKGRAARFHGFFAVLGLLGLILTGLFIRSFSPNEVVFSNDGPIGAMMAEQNRMPAIMTGLWQDLNWLGMQIPSPSPTISSALRLVTTPIGFAKLFCPMSLLILGLGAWFCFWNWRLSTTACVLGALAAGLSSHFLSTSCWGVASQVIAVAMAFVAVGLLGNGMSGRRCWGRVLLAGLAVGMCVMEGYDIGAIFSIYVAAFGFLYSWFTTDHLSKKLSRGLITVTLVAVFAAFLAAHALSVLVGTQIKGVTGTEQTTEAKKNRWDFATQWSMPPGELPRVIVPGLFGYRMDTPKDVAALPGMFEGGVYWGKVGRMPELERIYEQYLASGRQGNLPQLSGSAWRFSGGGEYAGLLVVAVALWAIFQAGRGKGSVYDPVQRKSIWFWTGAAVLSVLFAFGKFAPFYRFVYMLPYFSTIRNPAKFMHPFHWCLIILFAYGIDGFSKRFLGATGQATGPFSAYLKTWWAKADLFDKRFVRFSYLFLAVSVLGWLIYAGSSNSVIRHLQETGYPDPSFAAKIAAFSVKEVGWYVLFLLLTIGLLTIVFSGRFGGHRAKLGGILLGILLVVDLTRADLPWIIYENYVEKNATNPIIDILRERPYEHRVTILPSWIPKAFGMPKEVEESQENLEQLYRIEWMQHQFPFYNIQCLDVIQMPRVPVDMELFEKALQVDSQATIRRLIRRWELTNTRYLLGPAIYLGVLNQGIDAGRERFKYVSRFDILPRPGVTSPRTFEDLTAVVKTNGNFALYEFGGALPRAKLFGNWQVITNDNDVLTKVSEKTFNPEELVLVDQEISKANVKSSMNQNFSIVEILAYAPKRVTLKTKCEANSVLLINDKYDPNWKVTVDGKETPLLRNNYIMQGVSVPTGQHTIQLFFTPPGTGLYISLVAIVVGILLIGFLVMPKPREILLDQEQDRQT